MRTVLFVVGGGALGTLLRFLIARALNDRSAPLGTVLVNVLGCFLLGALVGRFGRSAVDEAIRTGLGVGLLGGFTTFSTWAFETVDLVGANRPWAAAANLVLPAVLGVAAAAVGLVAGRSW